MRDDPFEKLRNLLTLELGMYGTLRKMVGRELEAIVLNSDMEELLSVLQEKQDVISQLQLLTDAWADALPALGVEEFRGSEGFWEKVISMFPEEQAAVFRQTLAETRTAAEDLVEAEKGVQSELEKHVSQLREKMLQMNHGRSAFIGYAKMGGGNIDLGEGI